MKYSGFINDKDEVKLNEILKKAKSDKTRLNYEENIRKNIIKPNSKRILYIVDLI